MAPISPHDWLRPRLSALVAEAEAAGIARDVSVALITDLINGPDFGAAAPVADENWNQDVGEPDYLVNVTLPPADDDVSDAMPPRRRPPDHVSITGKHTLRAAGSAACGELFVMTPKSCQFGRFVHRRCQSGSRSPAISHRVNPLIKIKD